ncbi:MAG: PorT family protein, partial [Saprospiraceae bacterium]|nr:PorT family protein [Saprospiraceae bacterium]
MDNIDDLMRQKFDSDEPGERFEFKEEYWEQAEALLKLEDERRKRRGWALLGLLLLLLSLMLAGWWFLGRADGGQTQIQEKEPIKQTELGALKEQENNTRQINTNTLQEPIAIESKTAITRATTEIKQPESIKKSTNKTAQLPGTAQRDKLGHWKLTDANKPSQAAGNAAETAPTTPITQNVQANNASTKEEASTAGEKEAPAETFSLLALSIIQIELMPLPVPERAIPEKKQVLTSEPAMAGPKKTAKPERRFSAGVSLLGSVNAPDQAGRRLGLAAGGYVQYNLNRQWALQLGGQYRLTPGYAIVIDSTPVATNIEQLRYSFGYQITTYKRETVGLHHLEMPLALQWKRNRMGLEAGATLGYLLMVEDKTTLRQETSLDPLKEEKKRFVTGDRTRYKPF